MATGYVQQNAGSAWTALSNADAATVFEPTRASIIAVSFAEFSLGGSRSQACQEGGGYKDVPEFIDFTVPTAIYGNSSGMTFEAVIETRVENSGISLTPKIRNLTDSSDLVVGSASTSTTGSSDGQIWASQTLTATFVVGKVYRLMVVKSADTYAAWAVGKVRRKGT